MIRAYDEYGNIVDLVEWETYIRAAAIDDAMIASAKAICIGCGYRNGTKCTYTGRNCSVSKPMLETVMKALEQLKVGANNGADNQ